MKKSLLLVAFATCATSAAFAQRAASVNNFSVQNMAVVEAEECPAQDLYISNGRAAKVQKAEEGTKLKAWYHRPAGSFYLSSYTTEGKASYSTWYAPYLMMRALKKSSFLKTKTKNAYDL